MIRSIIAGVCLGVCFIILHPGLSFVTHITLGMLLGAAIILLSDKS